ncbi:MAG: DUF3696 domain-containing protein [Saprospiraceae bacterium]|nr:MAG: DUF3696 domain-containing protein [Saprospiraceae bacterium]
MLKRLKIKNFKSLKEADLALGKLNLLAGINGMGKSSLIQALLLLKQSSDRLGSGTLNLNDSEFVALGKGRDIFYQYSEDHYITFGLENEAGVSRNWNFEYHADRENLQSKEQHDYSQLTKHFNLFTDNFQYLNAERIGPRQSYSSSTTYIKNRKQIGSKGEYAVHYLNVFGTSERIQSDILHHPKARSRSLIHEVDAWLGEISPGTKLNTTAVPGTEMVLLDIRFETKTDYTNHFRPVNVGFGISFVLPVILALLMAKKDRLIIIENPEAHLHPKGQAEMGRLMALAAKAGAQIIAETHSDHILNGVRVAVKNGDIPKDDARIFFFDRKTTDFEQYSYVTPIKIDHKGELSEYPPNFLDEWNNQLFKLI